jgi:hypothetical protein
MEYDVSEDEEKKKMMMRLNASTMKCVLSYFQQKITCSLSWTKLMRRRFRSYIRRKKNGGLSLLQELAQEIMAI